MTPIGFFEEDESPAKVAAAFERGEHFVTADPCACDARCSHGKRCMAGHACYPDTHWYLCEACSPTTCRLYPLRSGQYLAVVTACGHALGPGTARDLPVEARKHQQRCMQLDPHVRTEPGRRWGGPHINGISVEAIGGVVLAGESVAAVAEDYSLTRPQILVACWWLATHDGSKATRQHWADWAQVAAPLLAASRPDYDAIPDPPSLEEA